MSYRKFQTLIGHPAPGIVCRRAGDGHARDRYTARVRHEVGGPAYSRAVMQLTKRLIPLGAEQLAAFYARHDGFTLYRDVHSDAAGVRLFALGEIEEQTASYRRWLRGGVDEASDPLPYLSAVAIGEVPRSANYFIMTTTGPNTGKVFLKAHDDWDEGPFATSFDAFLARICTRPAQLLTDTLGGFARYVDDRTDIDWYPVRYVRDATKA